MADAPSIHVGVHDPLRTFQFRLKFVVPGSSDYVAGVRSLSGLGWNIAKHEVWSGGNNLHPYALPHRISWEPITLAHGIARDTSLEAWADAARTMAESPAAAGARNARRSLQIDVWDPTLGASAPMYCYVVYNAWVSKYVALPKLDSMTSEIALATLEISHEGWQRTTPPSAS